MSKTATLKQLKKNERIVTWKSNIVEIWKTTGGLSPPNQGGWKELKLREEGRRMRQTGGSCKQTISGGALTAEEELNKERKTFQLPRLLCWKIVT